jgi:hypothetical protein
MGNSKYLVSKTINLHEKKDPYRDLWRNVLIVGIEDFLKKREIQIKFDNKKVSLEELWFHHEDFNLVCEWAQLEPSIVKKRVYEAIERIKKKYAKKDMSEMPGKWFYKSKGINREPNRYSTTMYPV